MSEHFDSRTQFPPAPPQYGIPYRFLDLENSPAAQHWRQMRLEALKLALDTVVDGASDRSGNTTASAVMKIAERYLGFIIDGPVSTGGKGKRREKNDVK